MTCYTIESFMLMCYTFLVIVTFTFFWTEAYSIRGIFYHASTWTCTCAIPIKRFERISCASIEILQASCRSSEIKQHLKILKVKINFQILNICYPWKQMLKHCTNTHLVGFQHSICVTLIYKRKNIYSNYCFFKTWNLLNSLYVNYSTKYFYLLSRYWLETKLE